MERCLACRARLAQSPVCPRCGCDFSLARRAEEDARRLVGRAVRALAAGEREAALARLATARGLKVLPLGRAVEAFVAAQGEGRAAQTVGTNRSIVVRHESSIGRAVRPGSYSTGNRSRSVAGVTQWASRRTHTTSIAEMMHALCFRTRLIFDRLRMTRNSATASRGPRERIRREVWQHRGVGCWAEQANNAPPAVDTRLSIHNSASARNVALSMPPCRADCAVLCGSARRTRGRIGSGQEAA